MIDDIAGPAYPFRIDPTTGGIAWATGRDKIQQNLRVILGTRLGERPMQRAFGTRIPALAHDPNDGVIAELAQVQVRQALSQWEPRVLVTNTRVLQQEGEFQLAIQYVHTEEPVTGQLVLPLA